MFIFGFFLVLLLLNVIPYEEVNWNSGGKWEQSFGAVEIKLRKIHLTTFFQILEKFGCSQMDYP